ncbi:phage holin family protein [Rhodococcus sp. NPDC057529]|uniref:phage holin family protein n=1 Tax=Rhodococcus sp. NPDC057529 TaxID=3346158 RepID=UPI00366E4317
MTHTDHPRSTTERTGEPPGAAHQIDHLSTVQLVERLTEQVKALVQTEIRHGIVEMKDKGTRFGVGAGLSGAGLVIVLYGLGALVAAAVLGLATVLDPWLAGFVVAIVLVGVGGIVAAVGGQRAKKALPPTPADTRRSVHRDVDTVKESLR